MKALLGRWGETGGSRVESHHVTIDDCTGSPPGLGVGPGRRFQIHSALGKVQVTGPLPHSDNQKGKGRRPMALF
eukprot:scaffold59645_cov28-Tisochrysis_lutea.AAC.1